MVAGEDEQPAQQATTQAAAESQRRFFCSRMAATVANVPVEPD
jgi:hypothetical protein